MENPRLSSREDIVVLVTSYFPLPCQRTFGFAGGQEPEQEPNLMPDACSHNHVWAFLLKR
jgi:hypothetical protein